QCESATLRTRWVLVVMDQFTRRIIGFGVHSGVVDGVALCRMFHRAIRGQSLPKYFSLDHDSLSRREYFDRTLFCTTADLETKLLDFQRYYNGYRTHVGLEGRLPEPRVEGPASLIDFGSYRWQKHCRGLYQTPIAA